VADLGAIADTLYAQLPARFIAERGAAAKKAKADGDREASAEIARLTKPSVSAWAVNMLARHRADTIASFLELGETLRSAQHDLDATALRQLTAQRRKVVEQLADQAEALGEELGQKVGPSARDEVEQTLQAALADENAGTAVRSGRLVRALSSTGFDAVDLAGAVAQGDAPPAPRAPRSKGGRARVDDLDAARRKRDDERAEAERKELERRRAEARRARDDAAAALAEAKSARDTARAERDDLLDQQSDLQRRLDEVTDAVETQNEKLERLVAARAAAADALAKAERALNDVER
jgi:predicted transcriptional regulator